MYFIFIRNIKNLNFGSCFSCICKQTPCPCSFIILLSSLFSLYSNIAIFVCKYRIFVLNNVIFAKKGLFPIKNDWNDHLGAYQKYQKWLEWPLEYIWSIQQEENRKKCFWGFLPFCRLLKIRRLMVWRTQVDISCNHIIVILRIHLNASSVSS